MNNESRQAPAATPGVSPGGDGASNPGPARDLPGSAGGGAEGGGAVNPAALGQPSTFEAGGSFTSKPVDLTSFGSITTQSGQASHGFEMPDKRFVKASDLGARNWMFSRLALPWPPSANRYWRSIVIGGSSRVLVSKDGREYGQALAELALLERWPRALDCRIRLRAIAFPPDRRNRDLDNLLKPMIDALKVSKRGKDPRGGVIVDDSQIDDERIQRGHPMPGGRVHVLLTRCSLSDWPSAGAWPS